MVILSFVDVQSGESLTARCFPSEAPLLDACDDGFALACERLLRGWPVRRRAASARAPAGTLRGGDCPILVDGSRRGRAPEVLQDHAARIRVVAGRAGAQA